MEILVCQTRFWRSSAKTSSALSQPRVSCILYSDSGTGNLGFLSKLDY